MAQTVINKTVLKNLRADIDAALIAVGKKHGVQLSAGNARYALDGTNATFKLNIATVLTGGVVINKGEVEFRKLATVMYGIPQTALGATIKLGARNMIITGLDSRKPKYPVQAKDARSGRAFKLSPSMVKMALLGNK